MGMNLLIYIEKILDKLQSILHTLAGWIVGLLLFLGDFIGGHELAVGLVVFVTLMDAVWGIAVSISNSVVDLTDAQRLIHYNINADSRAAQGGVIHNCKLYYGRGYVNVGHIELDAIDLISKCLLADIDLYGNGFTAEPEGAFIYNDELYISTNNNAIFKVEFE